VRRIRSLMLGVVLAVAAVVGVAPAASAAAFGIAWWFPGSFASPQHKAQVCPTGASFQAAQAVQVQVLANNAWVTQRTYPVSASLWSCIEVSPADVVAKPGRYTWRAVVQVSPSSSVTAGPVVVNARADANDLEETHPSYALTAEAKRVTVQVRWARGQIVELQRANGRSWAAVNRVRAPRSGEDAKVVISIPSRVGNAAYRVVNYPTTWTNQAVSRGFNVHQTDYSRYASYIASIRRTIVSFCPHNPIYVDTPLVLPGRANPQNAIGRAALGGSGYSDANGSTNTITASIHFRSGMTGSQLRHVAFHECAHVIQWRSRVVDAYDAEQVRAWRNWPYNGFEGQADCMAYLYVRDRWALYYVPNCTQAQLNEAARMWNTYGYRFQATPYTWRSRASSAVAGAAVGEVTSSDAAQRHGGTPGPW
jgi:hypothetical protein